MPSSTIRRTRANDLRPSLAIPVRSWLRFAIPVFAWTLLANDGALADTKPAKAGQEKQTQVTISKETTRILEPLREDGYPDYVAALEQKMRHGATPDNNVAVVLWQVVGPEEIPEDVREEYFKRLGMKPLPDDGEYLVDFYEHLDDVIAGDDERRDKEYDFFEQAQHTPWKRDEAPRLAEWLDKYDKQLDQMVEASRRTRYYSPFVVSDEAELPSMVIAVVLPAIGEFRNVARALVARAMLRVGEGKLEEAWSDLIACHRLGRLVGQGPTLIDALVGVALDTLAWQGVVALAHHGQPTPEQVKKFRQALDELTPPPNMVDKVDVAERFMCLDCVCAIARDGARSLQMLRGLDGDPQSNAMAKLQARLTGAVVDWDEVLKMNNRFYDRIVGAGRIPDSNLRAEALERFNEDMKKLTAKLKSGILGAPLLALGGEQGKKMFSRQIGGILLALLVPALNMVMDVGYRDETQEQMEHIALALAAYRSQHGSYPDTLSALKSDFEKLPVDAFTGAPFRYKRDGKDYTLYSVGPNAKDEGGEGRDGDPPADDVAIRTAER